jgi:chromosome condensin MukBEF complex kleisin-like MukF subunit
MDDQKTIEELVKHLRERVGSLSVAIVDLEVLLAIEQQKNSELEKAMSELKELKENKGK